MSKTCYAHSTGGLVKIECSCLSEETCSPSCGAGSPLCIHCAHHTGVEVPDRKQIFDKVMAQAWAIQKARSKQYGEEWSQRPADTHTAMVYYQAARAHYTSTDKTKQIDDLLDTINGAVFAIGLLQEEK